jgi:hypothetical protein
LNLERALGAILFSGLMFIWGMDCSTWARANGTSRGSAYWRGASVSIALVLVYHLMTRSGKLWVLELVTFSALASIAGVKWEWRKHPGPHFVRPTWRSNPLGESELDGPLEGYECWKCKRFHIGPWPYEARIQDREQAEHIFDWQPVCARCAGKEPEA